MNVKGKNIIITGGSLGIGKETARDLVKKGANVLITGRSEDRLIEAKKYTGSKIIEFDISDHVNIQENTKECIGILDGRVDVLINNAGIGVRKSIEELNIDDFLKVFNVNVFGLALFTKEIIPYMIKESYGTIINIGSISAKMADRGTLAYGCSKIALMHATKIMANEFSNYKIRVNGICPNATNTKMLKKMDPKSKDLLISRSFMKKVCEPIDVANLILYLSSKNSEYINGQIIFIDGGTEC